MLLKIANCYGNIDVRQGVPKGYAHVEGKRLQPLCRHLGIRYAEALVDWGGTRRYPRPVLDGVVVSARSEAKLIAAIEERAARNPLEKAARRHLRRLQPVIDACLTDAADYEARLTKFRAAFREWVRHTPARLAGRSWFDSWEKHGFTGPVAEALARVLPPPHRCRPDWFMEACLAVQRAKSPLDGITCRTVKELVRCWRAERVIANRPRFDGVLDRYPVGATVEGWCQSDPEFRRRLAEERGCEAVKLLRRFVVLPADPRVRQLVAEINDATYPGRTRPVAELCNLLKAEFPSTPETFLRTLKATTPRRWCRHLATAEASGPTSTE